MNHDAFLSLYSAPGVFTNLGEFAETLASLPGDPAAVATTVQGLLLHEAWAPAYGVTLSPERSTEKQLHGAHAMLTRATQLDRRPVSEPRAPEDRVVGVCRHFATLFVAFLRLRGVPSRARCGFGTYFFPPEKNVDHWVGEYWNAAERRWVLVDAQLDSVQQDILKLDFDPLDVPRDRFLVAGDAWRLCAEGADPMSFGVGGTDLWGLIEVYGNIFQDLAALQTIELLPWSWYGLATNDDGIKETELIDRLAAISSGADAHSLEDLRDLLAADPRLRVPEKRVPEAVNADRNALSLSRPTPP